MTTPQDPDQRPRRLDQHLSLSGLGSRKDVHRLIARGLVRVDGTICRDRSRKVGGDQTVVCAGVEAVLPPATLHVLLHKPVGLACSHAAEEAPLVYDLLPPLWAQAAPEAAGRLDRATSGLLLLSTDGALIHRLTNPKRHLAKRYRIRYSGTLHHEAVALVAAGLALPDDPERPARPAELVLEGPGEATLVLHEGRYHQVRRMITALGGEVTALHRDRIGHLDLPADLEPGQLREATAEELALLQQA